MAQLGCNRTQQKVPRQSSGNGTLQLEIAGIHFLHSLHGARLACKKPLRVQPVQKAQWWVTYQDPLERPNFCSFAKCGKRYLALQASKTMWSLSGWHALQREDKNSWPKTGGRKKGQEMGELWWQAQEMESRVQRNRQGQRGGASFSGTKQRGPKKTDFFQHGQAERTTKDTIFNRIKHKGQQKRVFFSIKTKKRPKNCDVLQFVKKKSIVYSLAFEKKDSKILPKKRQKMR